MSTPRPRLKKLTYIIIVYPILTRSPQSLTLTALIRYPLVVAMKAVFRGDIYVTVSYLVHLVKTNTKKEKKSFP